MDFLMIMIGGVVIIVEYLNPTTITVADLTAISGLIIAATIIRDALKDDKRTL